MQRPVITTYSARCAGKLSRGCLLGVLLIVSACAAGPPVQEMSDARQAIAVAREAGASKFAAVELHAAEDYLNSALRHLSRKAYELARSDAIEAKNKALAALRDSEHSDESDPR